MIFFILEPNKNSYRMGEFLTHFNDLKITALGAPKPYITGRGEDTNKSILDFQNLMFE